jgi:hypothetical protein
MKAMKKVVITALCLLAVVFIQCHSGRTESTYVSDGNTTVKTSETKTTYTLEASFNKEKLRDVHKYINSAIEPSAHFAFEDRHLDTSTSLDDGTTFHIKADRGELTLTFDKQANSDESYKRVKQLYEGIKKIVR